jgi:hypothetical protein
VNVIFCKYIYIAIFRKPVLCMVNIDLHCCQTIKEAYMEHFIGKTGSTPTPTGHSDEASLAVSQFLALARGEWVVRTPANAFRVEEVITVERYCLMCCGLRPFDAIRGRTWVVGVRYVVMVCRCCGREVTNAK